ncbi:MAG TPA: ABC transporter permease, partial [Elainellaceae cyanobacterium]
QWHRAIAWFESGIGAIALNDIARMFRSRQTILIFIVAPLLYIAIYGLALNPDVQNIKLGVVDYSNTPASRELISTFVENRIFAFEASLQNQSHLEQSIEHGRIATGLVIPPDFERSLQNQTAQNQTATVQVLMDGVNANTTGILNGYVQQLVNHYSETYHPPGSSPIAETGTQAIALSTAILYNPGLVSSWYFIPGVLTVILLGVSVLSAATAMTIEKEQGSFDQLIMTPITPLELLIGKLLPLFVLMLFVVALSLGFAGFAFHLPIRGSILLVMIVSGLFILIGLGIGLLLGILSQNFLQAYLLSFFLTVPMIQLSGTYTPIESMPRLFQHVSQLNPLRHYVVMIRHLLLKGTSIEPLLPHFVILCFSIVILAIAIHAGLNQSIERE